MRFSTDGFNERTNYIRNSNDANKLRSKGLTNFDNSFAKMRSEERRNIVETTNQDKIFIKEDVKGNKDKFLLMNNNLRQVNSKPNVNNPLRDVINRNMFKQ